MDDLRNVLTADIYGNSLLLWGVALVCAFGVYAALLTARRILVERFVRADGAHSYFVSRLIGSLARATQQFFVIALALGAIEYILVLPARVEGVIAAIVTVAIMIQLGIWGTTLIGIWVARNLVQMAAQDPDSASAAQIIQFLCLVAMWSAILLVTLGNFGIDITALVAGLGIGGIAIAFALQSILKDLFASLAIVLDKPFVVGDFIIFGDQLGSVERIGLKTTRVRSLWGEQITVSNDDLLNTRVRNYKRMQERRVSFDVRVTYETPVEKLEKIPGTIRAIIEAIDATRFDRSHVASFEDNGPRIETVYYVLSPDYNVYMDIQQRINLGIARYFAQQDVSFAYPTRRLLTDGAGDFEGQARVFAGRERREANRRA